MKNNFLLKLFGIKRTQPKIESITCGERDEKGFCDTYVNGKKTNVRMLVFTEEEIKRLNEAQKAYDDVKDLLNKDKKL